MHAASQRPTLRLVVRVPKVVHVVSSAGAQENTASWDWKSVLAGGLLLCSELMPFIGDTQANGLTHAMVLAAGRLKQDS